MDNHMTTNANNNHENKYNMSKNEFKMTDNPGMEYCYQYTPLHVKSS